MQAKFDVNITVKDLYAFLINNTYRKFTGVLWVIFSICCIGVGIYTLNDIKITSTILLFLGGAFFLILNPILLYSKAKNQVKKNKYFAETLSYTINEKGIEVAQAGEQASVKWEEMWKAVRYGNIVVVYVTTIRAFILPVESMGDQYNTVVELAFKGLGARNHLRKKK